MIGQAKWLNMVLRFVSDSLSCAMDLGIIILKNIPPGGKCCVASGQMMIILNVLLFNCINISICSRTEPKNSPSHIITSNFGLGLLLFGKQDQRPLSSTCTLVHCGKSLSYFHQKYNFVPIVFNWLSRLHQTPWQVCLAHLSWRLKWALKLVHYHCCVACPL